MAEQIQAAGLKHSALFYKSDNEFLDAVVPFILEGVRNSEPVFVAVPEHNLELLRTALGDRAASVEMADIAEIGANPARAFGELSLLSLKKAGQPLRWVGEQVWLGRPQEEYPACVKNEALVNIAFADRDLKTLCPYDADHLTGSILEDVRRTHPQIVEDGVVSRSGDYATEEALASTNVPLVTDPAAVSIKIRYFDDLSEARAFATRYAADAGLSPAGIGDLQLIITELATNSLKYTGDECRLALWQRNGKLVCEVRDHGCLTDPMAGRRAPTEHAESGRGLFLVNAIADLVQIYLGPDGTTLQVQLRITKKSEVAT